MHTFVLIMTLIGAGESVSTAQFSSLQQCSNAGNAFVRASTTNMGHRASWVCQQSDAEPNDPADEMDEMSTNKYSEMNS